MPAAVAVPPTEPALDVPSPWREAWRVFRTNKAALVGLLLLALLVLMMAAGPAAHGVAAMDIAGPPFTEPFVDARFWLGTDYLGRDVLAGVLVGGRATMLVGLSAAAVAVSIGITVGALAGFFGGWVDHSLSRLVELCQVLPTVLFAIVLVTLFTPSFPVVVAAIGLVAWTATARLARAEFMRLRDTGFVRAARTMGAGPLRLLVREILPNALPPLVVSGTLIVGAAIQFETGLSFLGLTDPDVMSWGGMIGNSRRYVLECWWAVSFPGAAIFLAVLSVSLVGDGLNDALNPKLHRR